MAYTTSTPAGSCCNASAALAACSTSPRVRGEVDLRFNRLRAERQRSEASRVRGYFPRLGLAATPPRPDSFAPLRFGIRPFPACARLSGEKLGIAELHLVWAFALFAVAGVDR